MLNYSGLINLFDIPTDKDFGIGSIFRIYDVGRLDALTLDDNYYDLILVDVSSWLSDSIALVNITLNSDNRGRIEAMIEDVDSKYFIPAQLLQNYFSSDTKIYFVEDINLLKK
jgi:hypothetical protein